MSLRARLMLLHGVVIALVVLAASVTTYLVVRQRLIDAANQSLLAKTDLVEAQIADRFQLLLARITAWSRSPYVLDVVFVPDDLNKVDKLNSTFQDFVHSESILQTIYLMDETAACIASSMPTHVGLREMQDAVSVRQDFLSALQGKFMIMGPFKAISSGRPCVAISVPVQHQGRVEGVLRAKVDVGWFDSRGLRTIRSALRETILVFTPHLDLNMYAGYDFNFAVSQPYKPPDIPISIPGYDVGSGVVSYTRQGTEHLAAFRWMDEPRWLILVETHLDQVLKPIKAIGHALLAMAGCLLLLAWAASGLGMRPILAGVRECSRMVGQVGAGNFSARANVASRDDIGDLARGLNAMAGQLQQHELLRASESTYKDIFEHAVEGIFQTTPEGKLLSANTAMLEIVQAESLEALQQPNIREIYEDPRQREAFLEILRTRGRIRRFPFRLKGLHGQVRHCLINARAEFDAQGRVSMIQGILADVTAERMAVMEQERMRQGEQLALEARLGMLRHQLNPHFFYNVLNTVDAMSRRSPERMTDLLQKLFTYLRCSLAPNRKSYHPLACEIEMVRVYLEIEAVRFQDALRVDWAIAPELETMSVPDMILQPLVENAVKHGMKTSVRPLRIVVEARVVDDELALTVQNTGALTTPAPSHDSTQIGLANLRERLHLLYGPAARLDIRERNGWVAATIRLPA